MTNNKLRAEGRKVQAWSDTATVRLFLIAIGLLGLAACDPFEKEHAEYAESQRIHCLDYVCPSDILPTYDTLQEELLKFNGHWYLGPKEYYSSGTNGALFYWPNKRPGYQPGSHPEELGRPFSESAIEIFLRTKTDSPMVSSMYQLLMQKQAKGEVIAKKKLRNGLETWDVRSGTIEKIWYVATDMKEQSTGDPPVVGCLKNDSPEYSCTMGFRWRPDVSMNMRFSAKHGPDWPEIYQETIRVLQLLKKV